MVHPVLLPTARTFLTIFAVALVSLLASKGAALLPAFQNDDLYRLEQPSEGWRYVTQGRFAEAALAQMANMMGTGFTALWWPAMVLLMPVAAAAIALAMWHAAGRGERSPAVASAAAALAATWPMWSDLLMFRTAIPAQLLVWAALLAFVLAPSIRAPGWARVSLAALAAAIGLGSYQPAWGLFVAVGLIDLLRFRGNGGLAARLTQPRVLGLVLGPALYLALVAATLLAFIPTRGTDLQHRGGLIPAGQAIDRLRLGVASLPLVFGSREPTMQPYLFPSLAALVVVGLAAATPRRPWLAAGAAGLLLIVAAVTVAPLMLMAHLWLPARALFVGGFALALALALLFGQTARPVRAAFIGSATILALCQAGASAQILLDQIRGNEWDRARAQMIAMDVLRANEGRLPAQLIIVGSRWQHALPVRSHELQRGGPALHFSWAVQAAFREATGMPWTVTLRQDGRELCADDVFWPHPDSIRRDGDAVLVCHERTW